MLPSTPNRGLTRPGTRRLRPARCTWSFVGGSRRCAVPDSRPEPATADRDVTSLIAYDLTQSNENACYSWSQWSARQDPILTMMTSTLTDRRNVTWFIAWMLMGAGYAIGILGALSIGPYVLVITVAATIVLATRTGSRVGLPGLISGLSLPLFYVAFLNRSGPGTICTSTATSQSCVDEWSPWPWLAIGIVLLVSGCVWFAMANRRRGAA